MRFFTTGSERHRAGAAEVLRGLALAIFLTCGGVFVPSASAQEVQAPPEPIDAVGRVAILTPENTQMLSEGRRLARITFPNVPVSVLGAHLKEPAHQLLRRLVVSGQAAGNAGDLYENRDRGHSRLSAKAFPQLTHVTYDETFQKQGLDYGLGLTMFFDAPLIGNSSTAITGGPLWRSLPRLALTTGGGAQRLYQNYQTGQIHVYPEVRDHDPERGDLYPANTPYILISQGKSGSDQPHLEALAMILAAFRPDTKAVLRENGLVASTVQMVYRRARVGVRTREAYMSGAAHPTVFRERDIALARMVGLANAIQPDEVPPMVRLRMLEETSATEGVDYFGQGLTEGLFDTPSAIARVWRSREGRRSMVVTAADTQDPNGRELTFTWALLRGDPGRVRITPLSEDGRYVQIDMDWQAPQPAPGSPDTLSSRIDIGVFANNGVYDSAPAFISVLLPHHETREYDFDTEGPPKIKSINRQARKGVYTDPRIFPDMLWRDVYRYDDNGQITGWTRYRRGGEEEYNSEGRLILKDGSGGLGAVSHVLEQDKKGRFVVKEQLIGAGK